MKFKIKLDENDSRLYLQMLQDIINRMASNSSNCKKYIITIFTATCALIVGNTELRCMICIIILPIIIFYFLDAFYLGLENDFRDLENEYIKRLHSNSDCSNLIYNFNYKNVECYKKGKNLQKALKSKATFPLYLSLVIILVIFIFFFKKSNIKQNIDKPLYEYVLKQDTVIIIESSKYKKGYQLTTKDHYYNSI